MELESFQIELESSLIELEISEIHHNYAFGLLESSPIELESSPDELKSSLIKLQSSSIPVTLRQIPYSGCRETIGLGSANLTEARAIVFIFRSATKHDLVIGH